MKKHTAILLLLAGATFAPTLHAGVNFFVNNPAGFNTATSGLVFKGTENWEESTLAPNGSAGVNDPLAPGVANTVFSTGSLTAAGVTAQTNTLAGNPTTTSPRGGLALITASIGFLGTPSDQVSPNLNDSFDLIINPSGNFSGAVSLNPLFFDFAATSPTSHLGSVQIRVYDVANALLGTQTVTNVGFDANAFLGIVATGGSNIRRINLFAATNPAGSTAGADNIAVFGGPVPEPGSIGLILVGCLGLVSRRARRS